MQPRIIKSSEKNLIGKKLRMTFANNRTLELWQSFMPRRKEIINKLSPELFSIQVYPPSFDFTGFNLNLEFVKWAAIEVPDFKTIPGGMETFTLPGGLYAVFHYKGLSTETEIFRYIFGTWLPGSGYILDNGPHFEILGEKYRNNDPNSEEEIWIPVKLNG